MQHTEIRQLIELAADRAGSKAEVARRVGVTAKRLDEWMREKRPCPPEMVALIAEAGNLPPEQWLTRAVLWKHEGTEIGERLQRALGKSMRAIGAALALCIAVALAGHFGEPETAFS